MGFSRWRLIFGPWPIAPIPLFLFGVIGFLGRGIVVAGISSTDRMEIIRYTALLFVEGIPYGETRAYVQRVVANYWIYQLRMGQQTPTLDSIAPPRPETGGGGRNRVAAPRRDAPRGAATANASPPAGVPLRRHAVRVAPRRRCGGASHVH